MNATRRQFLAASAAALAATPLSRRAFAQTGGTPLSLIVGTRVIEVAGKPATVYGITRPDGGHGLLAQAGQRFVARVENHLDQPTALHWHGQTPPNAMDGVPGVTQAPIAAGAAQDYDFALRPGTHWMHSHHGLQEQRLLAAPMVVAEDSHADIDDIVVLLHDFSFAAPEELMSRLGAMAPMDHAAMHHDGQMPDHAAMMASMMGGMNHDMMASMAHANDLDYDAYLANDRELRDPQVSRVEAGGRVRLRLINGATTTAFQIGLGQLSGVVLSVDGVPVRPLATTSFPLAMGQRVDLLLDIPKAGGAWPILAQREGASERTGIILATRGATVAKLAATAHQPAPLSSLGWEQGLSAATPLRVMAPDRRHLLTLEGSMAGYRWSLGGRTYGQHQSLEVRAGERVELTFLNHSAMMHPMHLHGHAFQVVELNGQRLAGALRDTLAVPAMSRVTVALDADNPGEWVLHCHNLFHMAAGMMTTLKYV